MQRRGVFQHFRPQRKRIHDPRRRPHRHLDHLVEVRVVHERPRARERELVAHLHQREVELLVEAGFTPVEMEIRDQMQKVALDSPAYGYRRITCELQQRGFVVNHKRVLRMMREDNLLCVRRRAFVVTTNSHHNLPTYPNLARELQPTAINQLWVADITYIRLRTEFVYLAVVLDAFSRRVIGWALGRTLEAGLAVTATIGVRSRPVAASSARITSRSACTA